MDTNAIKTLGGSVNVVIHKNYLKSDDSTFAKVQRNTADVGNLIATVLSNSNLFDESTLVAVSMLFKKATLGLLAQGKAVNLFEIGTVYPNALGGINSANPNVMDIPSLSLGFTASRDALKAVATADVSMVQLEQSLPGISLVEDLFSHETGGTLTAGKPARIKGCRLKIAGDSDKTGLFFAPLNAQGKYDESGTDWVRIEDSSFFKNTVSFLEFTVPDGMKFGEYMLVIRTSAAKKGSIVNKSVRTFVYECVIKVNS